MENLGASLLLGQFALDRILVAHQNYFDAEILGREQRALRQPLAERGLHPSHRRRFSAYVVEDCLTLLGLEHGAATVKAAVSAGAVRQNGFAAVGARAPLRFGQAIVRSTLVLDSF